MTNSSTEKIGKYIVCYDGVENGQPLIKGTRLPVSYILKQIVLGWSLQEIYERYSEIKPPILTKIVEILFAEVKTLNYDKKDSYHAWYCNDRRKSRSSV